MTGENAGDVRDEILRSVLGKQVTACIIADDDGIIVETARVTDEVARLGLDLARIVEDGRYLALGLKEC